MRSGNYRRHHAGPVRQRKLARIADDIQSRQQLLEARQLGRPGPRHRHELHFRARKLDQPRDSPVFNASAGAIHAEGAEHVATRRQHLDVVPGELEHSRIAGLPKQRATWQTDDIRSVIERSEIDFMRSPLARRSASQMNAQTTSRRSSAIGA